MLKRLYLMSVAHIITTASAGSLLTDDGIAERSVDTRKPSVSFRSDLVTDLFFALILSGSAIHLCRLDASISVAYHISYI